MPFGGWLFRLAATGAGFGVLCGCVVSIDGQTVFRPPNIAHKASTPSQMYLAGEEALSADVRHAFLLAGELRIALTHVTLGTAQATRPLILVCMGNASDRHRNGAAYASRLLPYGDVLLFDYPGYGDSTGSPSAANILSVTSPVMHYASGIAGDQPILLWGHSLGGFVCAEMASTPYPVSGAVFETTAANAQEVAEAWKLGTSPFYASVSMRRLRNSTYQPRSYHSMHLFWFWVQDATELCL